MAETAGDATGLTGDTTGLTGDMTGVNGDVSGVNGDMTDASGDFTDATGDQTGATGDDFFVPPEGGDAMTAYETLDLAELGNAAFTDAMEAQDPPGSDLGAAIQTAVEIIGKAGFDHGVPGDVMQAGMMDAASEAFTTAIESGADPAAAFQTAMAVGGTSDMAAGGTGDMTAAAAISQAADAFTDQGLSEGQGDTRAGADDAAAADITVVDDATDDTTDEVHPV